MTKTGLMQRVTSLAIPVALAAAGLAVVPAAAAEPTFRCDAGRLYLLRADGAVDQVVAAHGTVGAAQPVEQGDATSADSLGVGRKGLALKVADGRVAELGHAAGEGGDVASGTPSGRLAGAVDPTSGVFTYGGFDHSRLVLHGFDPKTGSDAGPTGTVTLPQAPGQDGDVAFDAAGRLWAVVSSSTRASLYVADALTASRSTTARRVGTFATGGVVTGAAFASDGDLYVATAGSVRRIDATSGQADKPTALGGGADVTDLGSCAAPDVSQVKEQSSTSSASSAAVVAAPHPRLTVRQGVSPKTFDHAGQALSWTSVVTNSGDTSLTGLEVTDSSTVSARTCAPVAVGGTLAAGASTTCTARSSITQRILDANAAQTDEVTVRAETTVSGTTYAASASATASSTPVLSSGLSLTATVNPTTVTRPGQPIAYTVVARNRGNQTLTDLLVIAPFPGLSALVCSPVALGGALAPGATTSCRATRTTAVRDLGESTLTGSVKASARTRTKAVSAAVPVTVAVAAPPPVATDDTVPAVDQGPSVVLAGATNDHPAEAGGPAVDPTRTVLVGGTSGGKELSTTNGFWVVLPDGSIQLTPTISSGASTDVATADYRVYDAAGQSAVGHLTVPIRKRATCAPVAARTTPQNQPVTVNVLSGCDPGQNADGTPSAFDPASVRLLDTYGYPPSGGSFTLGGKHVSVTRVGDYTVNADGTVTFDPAPAFTGAAPAFRLTALSTAGSAVLTDVPFAVRKVTPVVGPLTAHVAYRHPAVLPVATSARPGDPTAPIVPAATILTSASATNGGKTLATYRGTWQVRADGSIGFTPADGFVGTTRPIEYAVSDVNGTQATATMTVTVQPGPKAVPDSGLGPYGDIVYLDPLANDVPGPHADGSRGSFRASSLVFPTSGQPAGATVSTDGHTLTVPDEGLWIVDGAGFRFVAFAVEGGASPVSYQATDDSGNVETGRITVAIIANPPAATDDEASTSHATAVTLPGLTNDYPGIGALVVGATVFPTAGQPPSAVVGADGKSVSVPGQGRWTIAADGSVLFTPTSTYVGTTAPVTYRVNDTTSRTATATLRVTVQPGPLGQPDAVSAQGDLLPNVSLVQNDTPGRNADGTLGTIDPLSVRLAEEGQPAGWTVARGGYSATRGSDDNLYSVSINPYNGIVRVSAPARFTGVVGPIAYTALDTTSDATGAVRHHLLASTLSASLTRLLPTATDDTAVTTNQVPVRLAGAGNDLFPPGVGFVPSKVTFPTDQLPRLPKGSTVVYGSGEVTLTVPGQGRYVQGSIDGSIDFRPDRAFTGRTTPVEYRVTDTNGSLVRARLTVTVLAGAVARPDTATTVQNHPVTVDVTANDDPGPSPGGGRATCCRVLLSDRGLPKGSSFNSYGLLTVPGQGTYRVSPADSTVTFTPVPQLRGPVSPLSLDLEGSVLDATGAEVPVALTSTLRITVVGVDPVAHDDVASTTVGQPLVVPVLANDTAAPSAALDGSSVRLRLAAGLPDGSALSGDAKQLTVPGRGVFLVSGAGQITFVPLGTATGPVPRIGYQVADANGSTARTTLTVTVRA